MLTISRSSARTSIPAYWPKPHRQLWRPRADLAPSPWLDQTILQAGGQAFRQIIKDLRESVKFTQINLVEAAVDGSPRKFDIIFCRNVLIYFDDASRFAASHNLYEALKSGGFICLGHSEIDVPYFRSLRSAQIRRCDRLSTAGGSDGRSPRTILDRRPRTSSSGVQMT